MEQNAVGWFEIPVTDMQRASKFYETVFEVELQQAEVGEEFMAWFPWVEGKGGAPGSLVKHEFYVPSKEGVLIYFSSADADIELSRVEAAGGRVVKEKTLIAPDIGYSAVFLDTEGNRIALHSRA